MDISILTILCDIVLGVVVGFVIGLTGVGGGVIVLPALTLLLGMPASHAVGTASLYAFLTKIYAGLEHFRLKTIRWETTILFLIGAIPGCIISSYYVIRLSKIRGPEFQHDLKMFVAWVLVFCSAFLFYNIITRRKLVEEDLVATPLTRGKKVLGIFSGVAVGGLIGSTSVGGGVLVIPLLIGCFGLKARETVGTSIIIGLALTLVAAIMYSGGGKVDYVTAILMAGGSLGGVYLGSRLSVKLKDNTLKMIMMILLVIATVSMFIKNGGGH